MRALIIAGIAAAGLSLSTPVLAAGGPEMPTHKWSFQGLFGTFDRGELQRGYQVYQEVCAGCHGLKFVAYRNLTEIGFTKDQVKAIAKEVDFNDRLNDDGEVVDRSGKPGDRFKSPYDNEKEAAAANNGAIPPDLSLMTKARIGGVDYTYNILTQYHETPPVDKNACRSHAPVEQPDGTKKEVLKAPDVPEGKFYNPAFPGCVISMPPPLSEEQVEYADKTKATVAQMARDVTVFLAWAAEPELEQRKTMGWKVILFLLVLTGLLYALKRKIWSDLH